MDECGEWMPIPNDASSISAWIIATILLEIEDVYPSREIDEYSEFTIAFLQLLKDNGIIDFDMEDASNWDRTTLLAQLMKLDKMDASISNADIEINAGFEGEVSYINKVVSRNGYKLSYFEGDHSYEDEYDDIYEEELNKCNIV
jgi:hypothetical protein